MEPLNSLEIQEQNDRDIDTTLWVHQNIIKLCKQFGICFKGCEKEAMTLFKKIDNSRQAIKQEAEKAQQSTIKKKGMNVLKGLVFDMNFKSNGSRSNESMMIKVIS